MNIFKPAGVALLGSGCYIPARRVTNAELGGPLSPDEIVKLSGIEARHWAAPDEATSDLAAHACRQALGSNDVSAVDRLVLGTVSPDYPSPSAACFVQQKLGLRQVPAYDVTASCSGFLFALDAAVRAVSTGDRLVLAVAADVRSRYLNAADRSTYALFGDGAGAVLVGAGPRDRGVVAIGLATDGNGARSVFVPAGGSRLPHGAPADHTIHMAEGPQVYFAAVEGMLAASRALLTSVALGFEDIDFIVPHQPNARILTRLAKLSGSDRWHSNIARYGNMSGASAAVALHEVLQTATSGARILVVTAGAGYTAGAALVVV